LTELRHATFAQIRFDVLGLETYLTEGQEKCAKSKGKVRMEGKEYVMADGDVVEFRFNV
jgi:ribosome-binding ATPase YchF (GTP1/OBG family)